MSERRRIDCFTLSMADYVNCMCKNVYRGFDTVQPVEEYCLGWNRNGRELNDFFMAAHKSWTSTISIKMEKNSDYSVYWVTPPTVEKIGEKYIVRARFAIVEETQP